MTALVVLPVVLPLVGAALTILLGRSRRLQRAISLTVLTANAGLAIALLVEVDRDGPVAVQAGGWPAPMGITLVADRLSAIMLVVAALMLLAVLVYAIGQPGAERNHVGFQSVYLVLAAGVSAAFLTGDLFNLFVAFEMMLTASYVLITLGGRLDQVRSGMTYVVISLMASVLFVALLAFVYAVDRHDEHGRPGGEDRRPARRAAQRARGAAARGVRHQGGHVPAVLLAAGQLSDRTVAGDRDLRRAAHQGRRVRHHPHPDPAVPRGHPARRRCCSCSRAPPCWSGVLGAIAQGDVKRILSFQIVSHIGYMIMGLGLFTVGGLAAAVLYMVHHIVAKTGLFLTGGLIEHAGGSSRLTRLGGMVRTAPVLAVLFLVPALAWSASRRCRASSPSSPWSTPPRRARPTR